MNDMSMDAVQPAIPNGSVWPEPRTTTIQPRCCELIDIGKTLSRDCLWENAVNQFETAIESAVENKHEKCRITARIWLADCFFWQNRLKESLEILLDVLDTFVQRGHSTVDRMRIWHMLGRTYEQMQSWQKTIDAYQNAFSLQLSIDGRSPASNAKLRDVARAQFLSGNIDAADRIYREVLEHAKMLGDYDAIAYGYFDIATCASAANMMSRAIRALRSASLVAQDASEFTRARIWHAITLFYQRHSDLQRAAYYGQKASAENMKALFSQFTAPEVRFVKLQDYEFAGHLLCNDEVLDYETRYFAEMTRIALKKLPSKILNVLSRCGYRFYLLKNPAEKISGFQTAKSHCSKELDGIMSFSARYQTVFISVEGQLTQEQFSTLLLHQIGHCIDDILSWFSSSAMFKKTHSEEVLAAEATDNPLLLGYVTPGTRGSGETFAELFAIMHGGGGNRPARSTAIITVFKNCYDMVCDELQLHNL
jgi:tetratricopeptide (TPR) repeat protein